MDKIVGRLGGAWFIWTILFSSIGCTKPSLLDGNLVFSDAELQGNGNRLRDAAEQREAGPFQRLQWASFLYHTERFAESERVLKACPDADRDSDAWRGLFGLVSFEVGNHLAAVEALQDISDFRKNPLLQKRHQEMVERGIQAYATQKDWATGTELLLLSAPVVAARLPEPVRMEGLQILLKRGQEVRRGGYYRDAVQSLELCTALGAAPECFFELGAAYSALGETEKATEAFNHFLKKDDGPGILRVGEFLQGQFLFDEAENLYLSARPEQMSPRLERASILLQLKRSNHEKAGELADAYLESNPAKEEWIDVAMDFQRFRRGDGALRLLRAGRELFPSSLELLDAQVRALLFQNQGEQGVREIEEFADTHPGRVSELSALLERLGLPDAALEFTLKRADGEASLRLRAAKLAYELGRWRVCNQELEAYARSVPSDVNGYRTIGEFYLERQNWKAAERAFREARKQFPEDLETTLLLARSYRGQGQKRREMRTLASLQKLTSESEARVRSVVYLMEVNELESARAELEKLRNKGRQGIEPEWLTKSDELWVSLLVQGEEWGALNGFFDELEDDQPARLTLAEYAIEKGRGNQSDICPLLPVFEVRAGGVQNAPELWAELGGVALECNKTDTALTAFRSGVLAAPEDTQARLFETIAEELVSKGRLNLAVQFSRNLGELEPIPAVSRVLAFEKLRAGQVADAESMLDRYFADGESIPEGCLATAAELRKEKFPGLALRGLERCIGCHGESGYFIESALAKLALGDLNGAETEFRRGKRASSDKGKFTKLAGAALIASGYPKSGVTYLQEAMATESRDGWMDALPALTAAQIHAGDREAALNQVQDFIRRFNGEGLVVEKAIRLLDTLGEVAEAYTLVKKLAGERVGSAEMAEASAFHAVGVGLEREAVEGFKTATRLWGGAPVHVARIGEALEKMGAYPEALEVYAESDEVHPGHPIIATRRAVVLLRMGDAAMAEESLLTAVENAARPLGVIQFSEPFLRRAARLDIRETITNRALEKYPNQLELMQKSLESALGIGELEAAGVRAERLIRIHPSSLAWVVNAYAEHGLDGVAHRLVEADELERERDAEAVEQRREALATLLRLGIDSPDVPAVLTRAESLLGAEGLGGDEWAAMTSMAMDAGEFERGYRYVSRWLEEKGGLTPRVHAALLAHRLGELDARDLHLKEGAALVTSAEEAQLFAEAVAELRQMESARGVQPLHMWLKQNPQWAGWIGVQAVTESLWTEGKAVALEVVRNLIADRVPLSYDQWKTIDSKFRWAGMAESLYAEITPLLGGQVWHPSTMLLVRSGRLTEQAITSIEQQLRPGKLFERRILAGAAAESGRFEVANRLLKKVLQVPADDEWEKAVEQRLATAVLGGEKPDWAWARKEILSKTEDRLRGLQLLQGAAREWELWDLEKSALTEMKRLQPGQRVLDLRRMELALLAGEENNYRNALEDLTKGVPNRQEVAGELADALDSQLEFIHQLSLIQELIRLNPGTSTLHWRAGRISLELGRLSDAEKYFSAYESGHWNSEYARTDIENVYLEYGYEVPASMSSEGETEGAWLGKEGVFVRTRRALEEAQGAEQVAQALALFQSTLEENKTRSKLLESVYDWSGLLAPALRQGMGSILVNTVDSASLPLQEQAALAALLLESQHIAEGSRIVERVLRSGTRNGAVLRRLASGTAQVGLDDLTERLIRQWVDHPTRGQTAVLDALEWLVECLGKSRYEGRKPSEQTKELALWLLGRARQSDPSKLWYITPEILEGIGRHEEAVQEFEKTIWAYPEDASGYNNLAYLFARRGEELNRAEELVDTAMRLEPRHNVYYMDTAGWIAFQQGRLRDAREMLEGSIRRMNRSQGSAISESLWHMGRVLEESGEVTEAEWYFRKAARLSPRGLYGLRSIADLKRLGSFDSSPSLESVD